MVISLKEIFGSWYPLVEDFIKEGKLKKIKEQLKGQKNLVPLFDNIFNAFTHCPLDKLKVVILSTNSYLDTKADGLALSAGYTEFDSDIPKALKLVFNAVERSEDLYLDRNPDLIRWAEQGVLLLNCDLTSVAGDNGKPLAHFELWKPFVKHIMKQLYDRPLFYVILGNKAKEYGIYVHPSQQDVFYLEHPQVAVKEKREWNDKGIFATLDKICELVFKEKIQWKTTS